MVLYLLKLSLNLKAYAVQQTVMPTTATHFNSYVCLFELFWSSYEGRETFDNKIWTFQALHVEPVYSETSF